MYVLGHYALSQMYRRCGQDLLTSFQTGTSHLWMLIYDSILGCASLFPFSLSYSIFLCLSVLYVNVLCDFFFFFDGRTPIAKEIHGLSVDSVHPFDSML